MKEGFSRGRVKVCALITSYKFTKSATRRLCYARGILKIFTTNLTNNYET